MNNWSLYNKISCLPDNIKSEVIDFIDFLVIKGKNEKKIIDKPRPKFGSGKGMFIVGPHFDEPLEDFKDYM